jgi:hypothetical protein
VERARQPDQAAQLLSGLSALGWFIWIFATVFRSWHSRAFAIGWRRPALQFILVMLTGLAVTAVFWLDVVAYATLNTASLLA